MGVTGDIIVRSYTKYYPLKGTLSRVDMRSSIHSLRDLSRSTAIMEISVSSEFCIYFALNQVYLKQMLSLSKANSPLSSTFRFRPELMRLPPCPDPPLDAILNLHEHAQTVTVSL